MNSSGQSGPSQNLPGHARTYWLAPSTVAFNGSLPEGGAARLHYSGQAALRVAEGGIQGGSELPLKPVAAKLSQELLERHPHLAGYGHFELAEVSPPEARQLLRGQLLVSLSDASGRILEVTGVQTAGVIDELFDYSGPLGVSFQSGVPTLRLWAPTARSVSLLLFPDPEAVAPQQNVPLWRDEKSGVWAVTGEPDWDRRYYLFEVQVYVPSTGRFERNRVTDPYSLSLAADSRLSQIVDLSDPDLAPPGWQTGTSPSIQASEDIVIYELHLRDFSHHDSTVPEHLRGTFAAFTVDSLGTRHLRRLAQAGLTHVHLLPVFDIATIPERREDQREPGEDLSAFAPDSERQQAAVASIAEQDGFNWGYDPYHYTVPEGSYATDPQGTRRILEFRQMVQAIHGMGLRVVMDVVYNHTHAAGQEARSVLDRIVPGYYHRRDSDGEIYTSSCCPNTASEHRMMEKLMLDSILTWVKSYRVDGFRFDLMGHHFRSNLSRIRQELDRLSLAKHGINGPSIYLYGEGWDFGEVENGARGINATQLNMAGSGIGTFNDRLRDAVRGGTPFTGYRDQGFATGLFTDPNGTDQGDQKARLLEISDWIRLGLAGNLADFQVVDAQGLRVRGSEVVYGGKPAAYTQDPQENVLYVEAHDNETLFDVIQAKAPRATPMSERVRMQNLAISLVALAQGVPFFHAGMELLRSKSMDRNSFNSGDWFNRLDFSGQSNNWGVGLPPRGENRPHWPLMRQLLSDPALKPSPDHIQGTLAHFMEMLRIRRSSPLFRLRSAAAVAEHLRFHNTGPDQLPGLLVMSLSDPDGSCDPHYECILVVFNGRPDPLDFPSPFPGVPFQLHPLQQRSSDPRLRSALHDAATASLRVPGRTAAVFVRKRD